MLAGARHSTAGHMPQPASVRGAARHPLPALHQHLSLTQAHLGQLRGLLQIGELQQAVRQALNRGREKWNILRAFLEHSLSKSQAISLALVRIQNTPTNAAGPGPAQSWNLSNGTVPHTCGRGAASAASRPPAAACTWGGMGSWVGAAMQERAP